MASFQFVKGTSTRTKNHWSTRAKVHALALVQQGSNAASAIEAVATEFDINISETQSYVKNAGSHIGRFRADVLKALASAEHKRHQEVIDACTEYGIEIEPIADENQ